MSWYVVFVEGSHIESRTGLRFVSRAVGRVSILSLRFSFLEFFGQVLVDQWTRIVFRETRSNWDDVFVQTLVQNVQLRRGRALHVEPPVASQRCLVENCTVWTQERSLSSVEVAVMPYLKRKKGSCS